MKKDTCTEDPNAPGRELSAPGIVVTLLWLSCKQALVADIEQVQNVKKSFTFR